VTKVLIDSSAWIHFFRQDEAWRARISELLDQDTIATCGLVITEVLRGARNPKDKKLLRENFGLLDCYSLYPDDYYEAAELGSKLSSKGYTLKTIDLLIAQICLKNKLGLLHDDSDFGFIAKHYPLKIISY